MRENRRFWTIAGSVFIIGIVIGLIVLPLAFYFNVPLPAVSEPVDQPAEPLPITPAVTIVVPTEEAAATVAPTVEMMEAEAEAVDEPTEAPTETVEEVSTPEAAGSVEAPVEENPYQETSDRLATELPPDRDDVALAIAYRGLEQIPLEPIPLVEEPLEVGTIETFTILNHNLNTLSTVEGKLVGVGDHAYFWIDLSEGMSEPSQREIDFVTEGFDEIYELVVFYFGQESSPGVDGDTRIHVFNASPLTICDVTLSTANRCGLLGYFSSRDVLLQSVDPNSNQKEMFVLNGAVFGTETMLDTLAHEFRHMIEDNYDANDWDWEVEGSAVLAEDLVGYKAGATSRGNSYLANPDQQLNRWTDGFSGSYYGQGYVLNRYIYDRFGVDLYREFATHPLPGLDAVTAVAEANGLGFTGIDLWRDWLVAIAIHNVPNVPLLYEMPDALQVANSTPVSDRNFSTNTNVSQYAVDYYELQGRGTVEIGFTGSPTVPLMQVQPYSGDKMWVANRANNSHARLTRAFDLTGVSSATLNYAVFRDIERGYDFAYASVSTDGGRTWQSLDAPGMDGDVFEDNPGAGAFTDSFYTGRGSFWLQESVDLSQYAGQEIHIRFEMVTDPILTFEGFAVDAIEIPEIGFFDDASDDAGWLAEGFVPATGYLPQNWVVQLVTFEQGEVNVTQVPFLEQPEALINLDLNLSDRPPILIVAAYAPMTLQQAEYELTITR